uniref:BTB domain-containing protein n=2 Tax=Cucumis melo TaxID=3656 RepID=A0A9I9DDE3_CUCME
MMDKKEKNSITVAPFECAWLKDLRFREAGRGCVAFEASAHNDVTLVFRENVGSQHYHYKRDMSPHYTVIIGSHRNRRLRIIADGRTVVDEEGVALCSSSAFQSYWISVYDGLISIGKGRYPFQNMVFQWLDTNPNCSVQYIGLSSWDKHVGYRNVNVLPLTQDHISLWKHVDNGDEGEDDVELEFEDEYKDYKNWGLEHFLENWDLSDILFCVDSGETLVPAHKAILFASGNFPSNLSQVVVQLHGVSYPVLHALLQYVYTGQTEILESQLGSLKDLALQLEVIVLVNQCDDMMGQLKLNKELLDSGNRVELSYPRTQPHCTTVFPSGLPLNVQRLKQLQCTGEFSDVSIYIQGHGFVAHVHKIILSLWSMPFERMFTNGMSETASSEVYIRDVSPEAFQTMLKFMYSGELSKDSTMESDVLLLQLLFLADQFGVSLLHQECCKILLECLSEDSVCSILQVVSSIPCCKLIEETCERKFSMHFDYCTTANIEFVMLDESTFRKILQCPDLTVTSEEKVLNAILMWGLEASELCGWMAVDELITFSTPEILFGERLQSVQDLLSLVRFPLLPYDLLKKLQNSSISRKIRTFKNLVKEAIDFVKLEPSSLEDKKKNNVRFQHRRSSYKELQYICDGDSNGVLFFAGTSYGEHQWVNPILSKKITITTSSPPSRYTDPKVLVSRTYQGTSFAGLRVEDGKTCSWWMVDIGEDHQLMCNYYTLRQDGSRAFIRYWNLQGSLDGKTWTNLRVHENDQTVCKPGQFASWPVTGPNALLPFRFFRVLLTAPTTDASNPWNLCICFLELYGYFL